MVVMSMSCTVQAQNTPCSGKKGGISHCEGTKFVCKDGSTSQSQKNCSAGADKGGSDHQATFSSHPHQSESNPKGGFKPSDKLLELDYQGFSLWLDCKERAAVKFRYNAQHDAGSEARVADFRLDPNVPQACQQSSTAAYGKGYDRGHQVPANHLDYDKTAIAQSNYMTNILPQTSQMNRGAWLLTEEIVVSLFAAI